MIREQRTDRRGGPLYFITVHPDATNPAISGHTYPSLDVALDRARKVAEKLGGHLQVWREVRDKGGFERLKPSD